MHRLLFWCAPIFTAIIIVGSLVDNTVPSVSIDHIDKVYHAFAYTIMMLMWYVFFYSRFLKRQNLVSFGLGTILKNWSRPVAIGAGVFCLLVGILIELGQEYISTNRTMDIMDVLANFAGIILAVILLMLINKIYQQDKLK